MYSQKKFIVAEIAQAHDGSLGMLHAYIDALALTGVDAIKFQTHIAEAESSEYEPFRVQFSRQDNTRFDYWKRMSFSKQQWIEIKEHCDSVGLEFMSTPFSVAAFELLESIGMQRYKIGSGDTNNYLLIDHIIKTNKPLLVSTGMSSYQDIKNLWLKLGDYTKNTTLMQCNTSYPTPLDEIGLNNLAIFREQFACRVGLSDHSGTIYPSAIAVTMGAEVVENHVVFDKRMFGPDVSSSLTIEEIKNLVDFIRAYETIKANEVDKSKNDKYRELKTSFGRSLAINKDLPKGHVIRVEDLESKKPANQGVDVKKYMDVIGKPLNKAMKKYEFLKEEDIQ